MFRSYETEPPVLNGTQDQIDEFFVRISLSVGYNLAPLIEFWGIPLSATGYAKMPQEKFFFPHDHLTALGRHVTSNVLDKYRRCVRKVAPPRGETEYPDVLGPPKVPIPYVTVLSVTELD